MLLSSAESSGALKALLESKNLRTKRMIKNWGRLKTAGSTTKRNCGA
jgi:hypothetical protein